jgi:large subunit ribosomal protein L21
MYAIVETGGKQYRVKPGDTIAVERLSGEPGEVLDLGQVLLLAGNGDNSTRVGSPGVNGAVVRAEVVEHARGEKIVVFRYKSKVRYRRKTGHRQSLTRLRITDILLDGASVSQREERQAEAREERAAVAPAATENAPAVVETEANVHAETPAVTEAPQAADTPVTEKSAISPPEETLPEVQRADPVIERLPRAAETEVAAHEDAPVPEDNAPVERAQDQEEA